ncbi:hypothetical protein ACQP1W_32020 [Spirillospora sp. CA-255316]
MIASAPPLGAHLNIGFFEKVGALAELAVVTANLPQAALEFLPTMREQVGATLARLHATDLDCSERTHGPGLAFAALLGGVVVTALAITTLAFPLLNLVTRYDAFASNKTTTQNGCGRARQGCRLTRSADCSLDQ